MKNNFQFSIIGVMMLLLLISQSLLGQTPFVSEIYVTDGIITDTIRWGLHPAATNGIDAGLGEKESPPIGPSGVFDTRFVTMAELDTTLGKGVKLNLRPTLSPVQIDTLVISCQSGTGVITLSWPAGINAGTLRLKNHPSFNPGPIPGFPTINVNMLYQFSLALPADELFKVMMIRTQAAPVLVLNPPSLDFGTVFIPNPASLPVAFNNTAGTADLVVTSLTVPHATYTLDKTVPWTIPAGTSDVLTVTFTPVVSGTRAGNIVIAHNADDWAATIPVTATGGDPGMYRSFTASELVTLAGGKFQKPIKRKANKVEYELEFEVPTQDPAYTTLHLELGGPSLGNSWQSELIPPQIVKKNDVVLTLGVDYTLAGAVDGKNKKFDYVFTSLAPGDIINIHGYSGAKKPMKAKYWWLPIAKPVKLALLPTDPAWLLNQPRLPMPSYGNVAFDIFPGVKAGGVGLKLGVSAGDPKLTGWVMLYDAKSMLGTLFGKKLHTGTPRNFDFLSLTKPFVKEQKKLPPEKHDNLLVANLIALKFNIIASQQLNTQAGFGELLYNEPGNALDGMSLYDIYELASPKMTTIDPGFDYGNCNYVADRVNGAFSGAIDTSSFGVKLVLKGTRSLSEVPYLLKGTVAARTSPAPDPYSMPEVYALEQNYPNPFNPTTTIEFNLLEDAIVTLKVYNALGQEVSTLIDREEMGYGLESVTFEANQLSSGVYFYRLVAKGVETGATTQIMKKMVLMK